MSRRAGIALVAAGVLVFVIMSGLLARVSHPGEVKILRFDGPSGLAITGRRGTARLVWKAGDGFPIVQCFRVRTEGDPLQGYRVRVESIDDPIQLEGSC